MKIPALWILICGVALASEPLPLDFPEEPTLEQLLGENGLGDAEEGKLITYVRTNWDAAGSWIPDVTAREEKRVTSEVYARNGDLQEFLRESLIKLQTNRLHDLRRITDAAIRELGRRGTASSLVSLLEVAQSEEREWVRWKALASVQEILTRVDPAKIDERTMMNTTAVIVAPLLRDLDPKIADAWAWTLWERQNRWLNSSGLRSRVPLLSRLWLARAFAASHPKEAAEVFGEGLRSQDPAVRTAAGMIVRSGIGGSMRFDDSAVQLMDTLKAGKWNPRTAIWDTLPLPLDIPLVRRIPGGRRDLVWLDGNAAVTKTKQDVWPLLIEPVVGGMYYSRIGDFYPMDCGLSDEEGRMVSRFRNLNSDPVVAFHGGLWGLRGRFGGMMEFQTDGSLLWECPVNSDCRAMVPISHGRVVRLGYSGMECRDRRGDLIWKTSIEKLDDPRSIIALDDGHFLVCCKKSVGWLNRDGEYVPILEGLTSSNWIRYHPTEPWVILDAGDSAAIVYDPKSGKVTGRFNLEEGVRGGKSRFVPPSANFPE